MTEPPDFDALELFRALGRHEVEYVTVGGVAIQAYGGQRMTQDLDVAIAASRENMERLAAALADVDGRILGPDGQRSKSIPSASLLASSDQWQRAASPHHTGSDFASGFAMPSRMAQDAEYTRSYERYVERNPAIMGGEPVIRGTRVPVRTVAGLIEQAFGGLTPPATVPPLGQTVPLAVFQRDDRGLRPLDRIGCRKVESAQGLGGLKVRAQCRLEIGRRRRQRRFHFGEFMHHVGAAPATADATAQAQRSTEGPRSRLPSSGPRTLPWPPEPVDRSSHGTSRTASSSPGSTASPDVRSFKGACRTAPSATAHSRTCV